MNLEQHKDLLTALDNSFQKAALAHHLIGETEKGGTKLENFQRIVSEWQEALEAYVDYFIEHPMNGDRPES